MTSGCGSSTRPAAAACPALGSPSRIQEWMEGRLCQCRLGACTPGMRTRPERPFVLAIRRVEKAHRRGASARERLMVKLGIPAEARHLDADWLVPLRALLPCGPSRHGVSSDALCFVRIVDCCADLCDFGWSCAVPTVAVPAAARRPVWSSTPLASLLARCGASRSLPRYWRVLSDRWLRCSLRYRPGAPQRRAPLGYSRFGAAFISAGAGLGGGASVPA
jgi:hypothetical protein